MNWKMKFLLKTPKKEGEVTIDKIPNAKSTNKDVGEYVDYEEID